jgi:alkaline phosphatase D
MVADDVDLVLHVGDYIYENRGIARVRAHDALECYTLDDYRQRYAIYKSDPDLQTAHAAIPWMTIPDDHEVDNDYAADHSEDNDYPAVFLARRAAAYQAYYEHMPVPRRMVPYGPNARLHARRGFGDLADIFVLDGRQYRDRQSCGFGLVDPCAELHAEQRSMLGREQEQWLEERMAQSRARWNLFAQQTVFAYVDQRSGREIGFWSDGWSGYPAARRRLTSFLAERGVANPVVLSGDVHSFLVNDVHVDAPDSPLVATELVTSSISSPGPAQSVLDGWASENANIRLARETRGYLRLLLERERLGAELVAVDDVRRADSATRVLVAFEVEAGHPGVAR